MRLHTLAKSNFRTSSAAGIAAVATMVLAGSVFSTPVSAALYISHYANFSEYSPIADISSVAEGCDAVVNAFNDKTVTLSEYEYNKKAGLGFANTRPADVSTADAALWDAYDAIIAVSNKNYGAVRDYVTDSILSSECMTKVNAAAEAQAVEAAKDTTRENVTAVHAVTVEPEVYYNNTYINFAKGTAGAPSPLTITDWQDVFSSNKYRITLSIGASWTVKDGDGATGSSITNYQSSPLTVTVNAEKPVVSNPTAETTSVTDPISGITIIGSKDVLGDYTNFVIDGKISADDIDDYIAKGETLISVYDFTLMNDKGEKLSKFDGPITVQVPIDSEDAKKDNLYARYLYATEAEEESDIKIQVLKKESQDYAEFAVNHFSPYAILATDSPIVKTKEADVPDTAASNLGALEAGLAIAGIGAVVIAVVIFAICHKREARIRISRIHF